MIFEAAPNSKLLNPSSGQQQCGGLLNCGTNATAVVNMGNTLSYY
jgi:hypothetical protein